MTKEIAGYEGELILDTSKADGAPFKTVDGRLGAQHFGWSPRRDFKQVSDAVACYEKTEASVSDEMIEFLIMKYLPGIFQLLL